MNVHFRSSAQNFIWRGTTRAGPIEPPVYSAVPFASRVTV